MGEAALEDCAEAKRTKRICRPALGVASGTDLRLALPQSPTRRDYERFPKTTEALIYVAMIRLATRRLAVS
jgi:hypothetical protein